MEPIAHSTPPPGASRSARERHVATRLPLHGKSDGVWPPMQPPGSDPTITALPSLPLYPSPRGLCACNCVSGRDHNSPSQHCAAHFGLSGFCRNSEKGGALICDRVRLTMALPSPVLRRDTSNATAIVTITLTDERGAKRQLNPGQQIAGAARHTQLPTTTKSLSLGGLCRFLGKART